MTPGTHEDPIALMVKHINAASAWQAWQGEEEMELNELRLPEAPPGERSAGPLISGLLDGKPVLYNRIDHTILATEDSGSVRILPDRWGCGNLTIGDVKEIRDFMGAVLKMNNDSKKKAKNKRAKR